MAEHAVFGVFASRQSVEDAVTALREAKFPGPDISVVAPENLGDMREGVVARSTRATQGATAGASSGAAIGGVLGWLIAVGALRIPGIEPFTAAGPMLVALAGLSVCGVVGGLTGALVGFELPEQETTTGYDWHLAKGGILVTVQVENGERSRLAGEILQGSGAEEISNIGKRRVA